MKKIIRSRLSPQYGAATLFTALMLLIGITLVTLLTSKTVITETQIAADNYRATQSVAAANYSMDLGVNYFNLGGFDQDNNNAVDYLASGTTPNVPNLTSTDGYQTTTAQLTFNSAAGSQCVPASAAASMNKGMITARGFSDDGLATRTITQCVGPIGLLNGEGPDMPFIARASVGLTGNAKIINRYTNTTSWSGEAITIGSSSSMETWLRDPSITTPLTEAQLTEVPSPSINNAVMASNRNLGNGVDIIDNDPTLKNLIGLNFFKNFFSAASREQVRQLAASVGQLYTSTTSINGAGGKSGLIWFDGDQSWTSGIIGSLTKPSIVVVNGDLSISSGSPTIYGVLYVAGKLQISGSPQIVGSVIVEGTATPIGTGVGTAASSPVVSGTGAANVVFWPAFGNNSDHPVPGLTTAIAGSWRDW